MYIFLLEPEKWRTARGYNIYFRALVVAASEEEAKKMHPNGDLLIGDEWQSDTWAPSPEDVIAIRLGVADDPTQRVIFTENYFP